MKLVGIFTLLALVYLPVYAQGDSVSNEGKVAPRQIIIEKDRQIKLPPAEKLFLKGLLLPLDDEKVTVEISKAEPELVWPEYPSDIGYERVSSLSDSTTFRNSIQLGYGNYRSPLAGFDIHEQLFDFEVSSSGYYESFGRGPVNDENSSNTRTQLSLSTLHHLGLLQLAPSIKYRSNSYQFYGNTNRLSEGFPVEESPDVRWSQLSAGSSLVFNAEKLNLLFLPELFSTHQQFSGGASLSKETGLKGAFLFAYAIDNRIKANLEFHATTAKYEGGVDYNRSLVVTSPSLSYQTDQFSISAGFNYVSNHGVPSTENGFYPNIRGHWSVRKHVQVYGEVSGNQRWNGLEESLEMNEFLDDSLDLRNVETRIKVGGGIKSTFNQTIQVDANLFFLQLDNLPAFVPSASDSSRYRVTYDEELINQVRFRASIRYIPRSTVHYGASIEINHYGVSSLEQPWHLPSFVFNAFSSHVIKEKFIINANLLAMSGIPAPVNEMGSGEVELDSFLDLSLGFKYLINNRFSTFLNTQNLFNQEYERYLGYPVRGAIFKVGGTYRF